MKIAIISAYTWLNKGDAGILLGTVKEIEEFLSDKGEELSIDILSFTPEIDQPKYRESSKTIRNVYSNILNPYPFKKTRTGYAFAMIKLLGSYLFQKVYSMVSPNSYIKKSPALQAVNESDFVIICGGGFLGGNKYNSLIHLAQIDILSKLNKKMVLWGTSIEPPSKRFLDIITKKVLRKVKLILPRESITYSYLLKWYPKNQIIPTPDMAFKTPYEYTHKVDDVVKSLQKNASGKKLIGITMREWMFPKSANPLQARDEYFISLVKLIDKLSVENVFVFIPQVIMPGDDDRIFADEVKKNIKNKDSFVILRDDFSPYELKSIISKMDQFLGTRMHSNIFSSTMKLPPVAIAYEKKTNGIMEKLSLGEYVVDIEDVNTELLGTLLQKNLSNMEELKKLMDTKIDKEFYQEIRKATIMVFEKLNR